MWLASQGCGWGGRHRAQRCRTVPPRQSQSILLQISTSIENFSPTSAVTLLSSYMAPSRVRRVSTSSGQSLPWEGDVEVEDITPPPSPPPPPAGVPQGDPHINQIIITVSDSSESEDDGFIEVTGQGTLPSARVLCSWER
jgi:hypothetical protein